MLTPKIRKRTWPPGNEKRRAGDIFMKYGTLDLFLTRNRMETVLGPKNPNMTPRLGQK
jgi:hypothetical protein